MRISLKACLSESIWMPSQTSNTLKLDRRGRIALSEAQVAEQVIGFLRAEGWRVHPLHAERNFKQRSDRREQTGCADYIVCNPYGWFYLEMKRPGGRVRKSQKQFELEALKDGCTYVIAEDFNVFKDWYYPYIGRSRWSRTGS